MKNVNMVRQLVVVVSAVSCLLIGSISRSQDLAFPKASEVLEKVVSSIEHNLFPAEIYPPGYFDWLDQKGDDLMIPSTSRPKRSMRVHQEVSQLRTSSMLQQSPHPEDVAPEYEYVLVDLGTVGGGNYSWAYAINNAGAVSGIATMAGDTSYRAIVYSNGVMNNLGTLGGGSSYCYGGLNTHGQVVGASFTPNSGPFRAFSFVNGTMSDLGTLGLNGSGSTSGANAVNATGVIVGSSDGHAFKYSAGVMTDLGTFSGNTVTNVDASGINDYGDIVGTAVTNGQGRAFLIEDGVMRDIGTLGGSWSTAYAVNSYAEVVGQAAVPGNSTFHAFFYDGTMLDLGVLISGPSAAYGINNHAHIVGASDGRAFIYSNGSMKDLNTRVINISGWTLQVAYGINDHGQIVGWGINPSGHTRGFRLDPLPAGWREVITATPTQPVYGNLPVKGSGKNSLVLVTHGWYSPILNMPFINPPDLTWLDVMSNSVSGYLTSHSLTAWQVHGYKWLENAWKVFPTHGLNNAKQEGLSLGNHLASQGWSHIHLIAHSAGAGLIQIATERIKVLSPSTTVHCTFLDPYVGKEFEGVSQYGNGADWSDHYFSRDSSTQFGSIMTGPFTESLLDHSYNVDVTPLDPNKLPQLGKFSSSTTGLSEPCYITVTSHSWPYQFYTNSIVGNTNSGYVGFGFPLSKEGGGWSSGVPDYTPGNTTAQILGTPDPTCAVNVHVDAPEWVPKVIDFTQSSTVQSDTGAAQKGFDWTRLFSGSPVWLATVVSSTNPVNIVSFNARFSSTNGAQGLLSVYWDDQIIGSIDERIVTSNHYTFRFQNATANSTHVLGFRLDPFTNVQSIVTVTNVMLNQVGVSQLFSLSFTGNMTNGVPVQQLTGEAGFDYHVQATTNLVDWIDVAVLANTNGTVHFYDQSATNSPRRFYRAIAPY